MDLSQKIVVACLVFLAFLGAVSMVPRASQFLSAVSMVPQQTVTRGSNADPQTHPPTRVPKKPRKRVKQANFSVDHDSGDGSEDRNDATPDFLSPLPNLTSSSQPTLTSTDPDPLQKAENRSLLVCIAFHYKEARLRFLSQVLHRLLDTYTVPLQIVVDSNTEATKQWVEKEFGTILTLTVSVHINLAHPYHLTWVHRDRMRRLIDDYDVFMYLEDDMDLPFPNYLRALENYKLLWPSMVPTFARVETKQSDGRLYNTDNHSPVIVGPAKPKALIERGGRKFVHLNVAYSALWLMPQVELRSLLSPKFSARPLKGLIRETGASFHIWQAGKVGVVEVMQDKQVHPLSWAFHLPNNKANDPKTSHGKLLLERVLCFRTRGSSQCL